MSFQRSLIIVRDRKSWELLLSICSRHFSCMTLKSFGLEIKLSYHVRVWVSGFPQIMIKLVACCQHQSELKWKFGLLFTFFFLFLGIAHYLLVHFFKARENWIWIPDQELTYLLLWPWEIYLPQLSYSFFIYLV